MWEQEQMPQEVIYTFIDKVYFRSQFYPYTMQTNNCDFVTKNVSSSTSYKKTLKLGNSETTGV